jgi:hypothetical protein
MGAFGQSSEEDSSMGLNGTTVSRSDLEHGSVTTLSAAAS